METNEPTPSSSNQHGEESLPSFTRRKVLGICSGCALAGATRAPRALAAWGDPIPIGALVDYTVDEISEKHIQHNFFVTRHQERLFATIATCPHKGNYLFRDAENPKEIICSGHDAVFNAEGKPVSGQVKKGLERFGIAVDEEGIVQVDTNKKFPEAKWDDAGSFISLKENP